MQPMKLEIYFDYLCEFCEIGHRYLKELLPKYPMITPVWRPCEAHPRTEEPRGYHSDLAIQGFFIIQEHGGNAQLYHDSLFEAVYRRGDNIENISILAGYAKASGVDPQAFLDALKQKTYLQKQLEANRIAYGELKIQAIPTYRLENGKRIDSILGVGVPKGKLEAFLKEAIR